LETVLEEQVGSVRPAMRMLSGAVALVLLIACANVANLQLARGVGRRRELATRAALGARGTRLARLLLTESLVLSACGGALGLALAAGALAVLRALDPGDVPRLAEAALHPPVLLFAVLVVLVSSVLFGALPIVQVMRTRLEVSREDAAVSHALGRSTAGSWVRGALVVAEIAMALVLLIAAGLLAGSFQRLAQIDPGYDRKALTMYVPVPLADYPAGPARTALYDTLLERVRLLPGVDRAGYVNFLPLFSMRIVLSVQVEGAEQPSDPHDTPSADLRIVSDGYFEAMGIELQSGRAFAASDRAGAAPVVIVNETFARTLVPGGQAVGERLAGFGEIVGVVGDVRIRDLEEPGSAAFYLPVGQMPGMLSGLLDRLALVVKTDQVEPTVGAVRSLLADLDPNLALDDVATMEERLGEAVAQPRFFATVLSVFSAIALGLALVGIYSVLSFARSQETRQVGIRVALGATPRQVLLRSLRSGLQLTTIGILLGIGLAVAASRFLESFLFEVERVDAPTYALLALVIALTATAASYLPARRAARADPVEALRLD
jgi:predicted permease